MRPPRPSTRAATPAAVDEALVARCRAGDREALDELLRAQIPAVERAIARLIGPSPDLEDLVQVTLVEAIRSFPRFRGEASVTTWLLRIAVHVTYHQLRDGVRRHVPLELVPPSDEPVAPAPPPDEALDAERVRARLHRLLDKIKPKKRIAFLLYTVAGHSVEEIAALTGASRVAVKSQLFFARRELQLLVARDPVLAERARALLTREVP